jgi:hypothetical protein
MIYKYSTVAIDDVLMQSTDNRPSQAKQASVAFLNQKYTRRKAELAAFA